MRAEEEQGWGGPQVSAGFWVRLPSVGRAEGLTRRRHIGNIH